MLRGDEQLQSPSRMECECPIQSFGLRGVPSALFLLQKSVRLLKQLIQRRDVPDVLYRAPLPNSCAVGNLSGSVENRIAMGSFFLTVDGAVC